MMVIGEEDQMSRFEYQIDRNLEGIKDKKRKQKNDFIYWNDQFVFFDMMNDCRIFYYKI